MSSSSHCWTTTPTSARAVARASSWSCFCSSLLTAFCFVARMLLLEHKSCHTLMLRILTWPPCLTQMCTPPACAASTHGSLSFQPWDVHVACHLHALHLSSDGTSYEKPSLITPAKMSLLRHSLFLSCLIFFFITLSTTSCYILIYWLLNVHSVPTITFLHEKLCQICSVLNLVGEYPAYRRCSVIFKINE